MWLQMLATAISNPGHTESPPQPGGSLRSKEALEEGVRRRENGAGAYVGKGLSYPRPARSTVWVVEAG